MEERIGGWGPGYESRFYSFICTGRSGNFACWVLIIIEYHEYLAFNDLGFIQIQKWTGTACGALALCHCYGAAYTGQDCNFDVNCISFRLREGSWKTNIAGILGRSPYPYRHVLSAQSVPTEPGREPKELT